VSVHLPPDAIRVLVDDTEVAGEDAQARHLPALSGRAGAAVQDQDTLGAGAL
jgi:hypothetical protein